MRFSDTLNYFKTFTCYLKAQIKAQKFKVTETQDFLCLSQRINFRISHSNVPARNEITHQVAWSTLSSQLM